MDRTCKTGAPERRRARRRERGVVLILALFVIAILLVIVPQFRFSARIERELAFNEVENLQMEALARAAIMRAKAALLVDLEDDRSQEDALGGEDGPGSGGAAGGGGAASAGGGATGAAGAPPQGPAGPHVDSLDEVWANGEFTLQIGEEAGFRTKVVITDEDSKLNLLLLFAEDEPYRREWRQRFERLLDIMRDGEPDDLSLSEANELLDRIGKWMEGDRRDDQIDKAPLASGDWQRVLGRSMHAPLSLAELCLAGGIRPSLLHGFAVGEDEQRKWIPGLAQVLTVWSNVEYVEVKPADSSITRPDNANDARARQEAPGVNNGRINVNTAPVWVLKSLYSDDELPYSAWDRYVEFRTERLGEIKREREELADATDRDKSERREEEEADEPIYPLKNIDDLRRIEGFSAASSSIPPEKWNKLASFLTVESNVFTITVMIGSHALPRRYYVARSVVWRRAKGGEPSCIPIVPFERVAMSSVDMTAFVEEMEEWSDSYSSGD